MKTYAYGFPRLGKSREFKKLVEGFWKQATTEEQLFAGLEAIRQDNIEGYQAQVDLAPDGEMTLYDPMLDTAILCGVFAPQSVDDYYALCRGSAALEMTKWFNTNYHYLITDFSEIRDVKFRLNLDHFALRYKKGDFPSVIGPFTFLKLSKGIAKEDFKKKFFELIDVYQELLGKTKQIQIEEPAFVLDLTLEEIRWIQEGYQRLAARDGWVALVVYYDSVGWIDGLLELPVNAIGLDFVRGKDNFRYICENGFPADKTLLAGLVDGRNVWANPIEQSVGQLKALSGKVKNLWVSNAAPLSHLPVSLDAEDALDARLRNKLRFAKEKLEEIRLIAECFNGTSVPQTAAFDAYGQDQTVQNRVASLKEEDFVKPVSLKERRRIHDAGLKLSLFPTTTIGSFPQTPDVRQRRAEFRAGKLSREEYNRYVHSEIDKLIAFQEELGLDVLVHGEFERTDMVEFFAQNLDGIATTQSGWIISYGTRVYRPPVIFGDVARSKPMTVDEIVYAQSKTRKPVKGMLTGAVTIIAWSFCREDIPVSQVAYQIGLSLRDEIKDYEKSGIKIVQVDEAAFREKAPIKRKDWPDYFAWAVRSFNLTTNTDPKTQIHTHMCYSEFGEIIAYINQMDFDVISIEASRSRGDIIQYFENIDFQRQIGLGVWDIHSPSVPSVSKMTDIVQRSLKMIPRNNFWLNPDCGLKTRQWDEVKKTLSNMVEASQALRA